MDSYERDRRYNSRRRPRSTERHYGVPPRSRDSVSYNEIQTPGDDTILLDHGETRHHRDRGYRHEDTTSSRPSSRYVRTSEERSFREGNSWNQVYTSTVRDGAEHRRVRETASGRPEQRHSRQSSRHGVGYASTSRTKNLSEGREDGGYADYRDNNDMLPTETERVEGYRRPQGSVTAAPKRIVHPTYPPRKPLVDPSHYYPPLTRSRRLADEGRGRTRYRVESRHPDEERGYMYTMPWDDERKHRSDSQSKTRRDIPPNRANDDDYYHDVPQRGHSIRSRGGYPSSSYRDPPNARNSSPPARIRTPKRNPAKSPSQQGKEKWVALHAPIPKRPAQVSSILDLEDMEINDAIPIPAPTPDFTADQLDKNLMRPPHIAMIDKMCTNTPILRQTPTTTIRGKETSEPRGYTQEYRQDRVHDTHIPTDCLPRRDGRHSSARGYDINPSSLRKEREYKDRSYARTPSHRKPKTTLPSRSHSRSYKPDREEYYGRDPNRT